MHTAGVALNSGGGAFISSLVPPEGGGKGIAVSHGTLSFVSEAFKLGKCANWRLQKQKKRG